MTTTTSTSKLSSNAKIATGTRSVTKEHDIHKHILAHLTAATTTSKERSNLITDYQANIPAAIDFITSTSREWALLLPHLPEGFEACKALRNFPLHLDQIEELGLPKDQYAMAMADTLTFLHWEAVVDAMDVEFVLARPRSLAQVQEAPSASSSSSPSPKIGSKKFNLEGVFGQHAMWLLDFDLRKKMTVPGTVDDDGKIATEESFLGAGATGFWGNDPWYPRPPPNTNGNLGNGDNSNSNSRNSNGNGNSGAGSNHQIADKQLWELFKGQYLETSQQILEERGRKE